MLELTLIDTISEMIAEVIINRFVVGDRVMFSICGSFDNPRWPIRRGMVVEIEEKWIVVKMDDENRDGLRNQRFYIGNSNLKRIEE